jgi:hypothetical protein
MKLHLLLLITLMRIQLTAQIEIPLPNSSQPQETRSSSPFNKTYVYAGIGFMSPNGGVLTGTVITRSGWGGSISWSLVSPNAKNMPPEYSSGSSVFFSGNNKNKIYDNITAVSLRCVKDFPSHYKELRFGVEAGPSYVKTDVADHFVLNSVGCNDFGCPPNYLYTRVNHNSVGLSLKAKLEFPFTVPFGLEIGLTSNINAYRSYFGVESLITLGYVRERKR